MTTYGTVRGWNTGPLDEAIGSLNGTEAELTSLHSSLKTLGSFTGWESENVEHAAKSCRRILDEIDQMVSALTFARLTIVRLSDQVAELVVAIAETQAIAEKHGLHIDDDGKITATGRHAAAESVHNLRERTELRSRVDEVVEKADEIGAEFRSCLGKAAAIASGNELHKTLIAEFQVPVDDRDTGGKGWVLDLAETSDEGKSLTRGEIDALERLAARGPVDGPAALHLFWKIREHVESVAEGQYDGSGLEDGVSDAFRHAYWNALMVKEFGDEFATDFATAHERTDGSPTSHAMDLHNNEVGRQIAAAHPNASPAELAALVAQAVTDGRLVEIDETGALMRTNGATTDPDLPGIERPTVRK